jgi:hypothetical protein
MERSLVCKIRKLALAWLMVLGCFILSAVGNSARAQVVPRYKVDPSWPKVLPNNWIMSIPTGIAVDKHDHIWVLHRVRNLPADDIGASKDPPTQECCIPAPSVLVFDTKGNVINSWGKPGYVKDWPNAEHGIFVDKEDNVWIGGINLPNFANPRKLIPDRQVLKFTADGKQLLEIGHPSREPINNADTSILGGPDEMHVDDAAHEVYIADGYLNRRVVVYDSNTGEFKRGWGAYGIPLSEIDNGLRPKYEPPPAPPPKQFGSLNYPVRAGAVMGVDISKDGLVYVSDRGGDRVQIFTKQGKFVKEFIVLPQTIGQYGSVWSTLFSRDSKQRYLYIADGENNVIHILNREDGTEVGHIGFRSRGIGGFDGLEHMAMDSHGNLYTAEVPNNERIQKFVPVK